MPQLIKLITILPFKTISWLTGYAARIQTPHLIARLVFKIFLKTVPTNTDEIEKPLSEYRNLHEYFIRKLKPGVRTIANTGIACPVDGVLRNQGEITRNGIEQVKGRTISIAQLLGSDTEAQQFLGGTYFNLYLRPFDYHRVHMPCDGTIFASRLLPGRLLPVLPWFVNKVPDLLPTNERLITYFTSEFGTVALIMVGALNVGGLRVNYDSNLRGNHHLNLPYRPGKIVEQIYSPTLGLYQRGSELGRFELGSTVVLLFEPGMITTDLHLNPGTPVKVGQQLA